MPVVVQQLWPEAISMVCTGIGGLEEVVTYSKTPGISTSMDITVSFSHIWSNVDYRGSIARWRFYEELGVTDTSVKAKLSQKVCKC